MTALPAGSLAGIGSGGELFYLRSDGRGGIDTTSLADPERGLPAALDPAPAAYVWPAWVADGVGVLVSTIEYPVQGRPPAQFLRFPLDGGEPLVLYRNPAGTGQVGPDLPHYANPSPDGRHVALLTQLFPGSLALLFVDALGRGPAQAIGRGSPLFSAWSPSADALLLHTGGELSLMEIASAPGMQALATNHVGYRVPAWSPDGNRIAVAAPAGEGSELRLIRRDGKPLQTITEVEGLATFAWSPDGGVLALASGRGSDPPVFVNLCLFPMDGGEPHWPRVPECLAFFWSPGGAHLALLVPDREGRVAWLVLDRDGRTERRSPPFRPSGELSTYVTFFDQYAVSHTLWSPDGSALLACGRMPANGTPPELLPSRISSFDLATGNMVEVALGSIAFWSSPAP